MSSLALDGGLNFRRLAGVGVLISSTSSVLVSVPLASELGLFLFTERLLVEGLFPGLVLCSFTEPLMAGLPDSDAPSLVAWESEPPSFILEAELGGFPVRPVNADLLFSDVFFPSDDGS